MHKLYGAQMVKTEIIVIGFLPKTLTRIIMLKQNKSSDIKPTEIVKEQFLIMYQIKF